MGENTQNKKIAIIIMASGYSERFGSNKLLESFLDKPLFTYTVDLVASCQAEMKIIATRYESVIQYVKKNVPSMSIVWNAHPERGISESIHLGIRYLKQQKECKKSVSQYACIHVVIAMMNIFDGRYLLHQKGVWDGINRNSE